MGAEHACGLCADPPAHRIAAGRQEKRLCQALRTRAIQQNPSPGALKSSGVLSLWRGTIWPTGRHQSHHNLSCWLDRPSARTPEEREAAFQRYLELSAPYVAAIEAAGDEPWFSSVEERRELYMHRHRPMSPTRPAETGRSQRAVYDGRQTKEIA